MTKKELLESFRESLAGIFADKVAQDDKEIIEFYLEVCCTIAKTYAEDKWIDCKDRLPEIPSEKYLVIYDNMVKISLFRGDHNKFQEDIYSSENNVTHWLPLPTKPLMP